MRKESKSKGVDAPRKEEEDGEMENLVRRSRNQESKRLDDREARDEPQVPTYLPR